MKVGLWWLSSNKIKPSNAVSPDMRKTPAAFGTCPTKECVRGKERRTIMTKWSSWNHCNVKKHGTYRETEKKGKKIRLGAMHKHKKTMLHMDIESIMCATFINEHCKFATKKWISISNWCISKLTKWAMYNLLQVIAIGFGIF